MTRPDPVVDSGSLRRRGAVVLTLFAVLWALVAASGLPSAAGWTVRAGALAVTGGILASALSSRPLHERVRRQPPGWYRRVGLVNGIQFAVIIAVLLVCVVADAPELVAPLIALVVGLHFLPLAGLFDQPQYRWTAAGLVGAAVLALGILALGDDGDVGAPAQELARVVVGGAAAATLWATAVRLAVRG